MENEEKTKEQLMSELATLRQRFTQLEIAVVMRKRAEALCATAPGVGQTPELGELLDSILAKVIEAIGADMGLVYLLDMTEKALLLKAHRRVSKYVVSQISSVKLSIEDLRKVPQWQARDMPFSELFGQATLRVITTEMRADQADAVVAVPFSGKGHLNGVMIVASRSRHEFSQDGLQLLGAVAKQMGLGAENTMLLEEVGKLSTSDTLTVVHNQRHFQARLGEELARSARYGVVFSVIMFEIDRFEEYIARSGQTAGDEVIGTMGNVLRDSTRQIDTGCRCDGSKFAVILPHTGPSGAKVVAERMRQSAEGVFKMTSVSTRFNLTISVGIASFPTDELSQEGLVLQADIALSAAKKQGGNQTCLASDVPGIVGTTKSPVTEIIENLQESGASVVYAAAAAVDARNQYTRGHSQNVAKCAAAIGKALELPSRQMRRLHIAALLHDIGKIGVPDTIVEKSEPLDEEEMEIMRKHPELGATIVSQIPDLAQHAPAIRHHHERYDGSGYPSGLKDKDVPLEARIIAVAEAYDNMTMPCPYRQVLSPQEALEELGRRANTQFDPVVVSAFSKTASAGFDA